jgi:hypothetical protein
MLQDHGRLALPLVALALLTLALGVAGCGSEESEGAGVAEVGDPVEVGPLSVTVVSSRYMDRTNKKDAAYLAGQPPAAGLDWFAVFVEVQNEGDKAKRAPAMTIKDARGQSYSAFSSDNPAALRFGETIEPGERIPKPGTTGQQDPSEGAIVIFRLGPEAARNQPLRLQVQGFFGFEADVQLDA